MNIRRTTTPAFRGSHPEKDEGGSGRENSFSLPVPQPGNQPRMMLTVSPFGSSTGGCPRGAIRALFVT